MTDAKPPVAPLTDERQRFEEAIYAGHFLRGVRIDPARQFWDLSAQRAKADLFKRDGDDYTDEAISAMWFGWQKCAAQRLISEARPAPDRDTDWILAMASALGPDSGFRVPIVPTPEAFKELFAALSGNST